MKNSISLLVGLKNNLEYTMFFYQETRTLYPAVEIVFTSYGSTDGTHEWLDSLDDPYIRYFHSPEKKTLSDTYNKCISLASKPFVAFLHNDMVPAYRFLESLEDHVNEKHVLFYSVVEPPVFAEDKHDWKQVSDFGFDIASFNADGFHSYCKNVIEQNVGLIKPDDSGSFFLCAPKNTLLEIGGLDPLFNPMFCEDDDLLFRLKLAGLPGFKVPFAMVYHFVSKTSRFSEEYKDSTKQIEYRSNRNFIRKWGFSVSSKARRTYNVGLIIKNSSLELLAELEPYCTKIYVDCSYESYIIKEQSGTAFDLRKRIKPLHADKDNDILVLMDGRKYVKSISVLKNLSEVIPVLASRKPGFLSRFLRLNNWRFRYKKLNFHINRVLSYEKDLIVNKKNIYDK